MARSSFKNQEPESDQPVAEQPVAHEEGYFRVKFHSKSSPNDPEDVVVAVNGEVLVAQRQKECTIPERFVEALKNARQPVFRQMPGESRKIVGEVMTFPFDILGEGTREEYLGQRQTGTEATRESISATTLKD